MGLGWGAGVPRQPPLPPPHIALVCSAGPLSTNTGSLQGRRLRGAQGAGQGHTGRGWGWREDSASRKETSCFSTSFPLVGLLCPPLPPCSAPGSLGQGGQSDWFPQSEGPGVGRNCIHLPAHPLPEAPEPAEPRTGRVCAGRPRQGCLQPHLFLAGREDQQVAGLQGESLAPAAPELAGRRFREARAESWQLWGPTPLVGWP